MPNTENNYEDHSAYSDSVNTDSLITSTLSLKNKSAETYFHESLDHVKIPQVDGMDSFSDDEDDNLTEIAIVEQDPATITAGFVFEEPISNPSTSHQSVYHVWTCCEQHP